MATITTTRAIYKNGVLIPKTIPSSHIDEAFVIFIESPKEKQEINIEKNPWERLKGVLKNIPEFDNKTSVQVQHLITKLWAKKYIS